MSGPKMKLVLVVAIAGGIGVLGKAIELFPTASNQGYAPEQPILFSHKIHTGDNKIPCLYCHSGAERSRHATVPALNVCMNCHLVVKTESPLIQQVQKAYEEKKPIAWVRVHELPDYVYFPHKRHVAAGVACEACHGDIASMSRVEQKGALTMGWCMECHRGETAPPEVLRRMYPHVQDPHGPVAPVQCSTCHH